MLSTDNKDRISRILYGQTVDTIFYNGGLPEFRISDAGYYLIQGMESVLEEVMGEGLSNFHWIEYTDYTEI